MSVPLGNTPEGAEFVQRVGSSVYRRAVFGDNTKLNKIVYNEIGEVDREIAHALDTVKGLSKDETKTPVAQEEAKKRVADRVAALVERNGEALLRGASRLDAVSAEITTERFAPNPAREFLYSDMRRWIADNFTKPNGIAIIREAVTTNTDFAAVVMTGPHQLLGLPVETLSALQLAALKALAPDAWALMEDAKAIRKVAKNYPDVARSIRSSFYNPALAIRAASRVDA